MATYTHTLPSIDSRRQSPFYYHIKQIAGDEDLDIEGGSRYEVPNHWELVSARLELTTDATVANRQTVVKHNPDGIYVCLQLISDALAASSTDTGFITPIGMESELMSGRIAGIGRYGIVLAGNGILNVSVTNGVAGDVLKVRTVWRWLNWELGIALPESVERSLEKAKAYR